MFKLCFMNELIFCYEELETKILGGFLKIESP